MSQGCGATVHAAAAGLVTHAGSYFGYGNAVVIENGGGVATIYGHMAWGSLRVSTGERVRPGTPLGAEGSTGNSTGCHLHFEVRIHGVAVDPAPFMAARGLPLK
jgi:murein DD-endopeptidase MepM/ murein hydrolase activator NlpD